MSDGDIVGIINDIVHAPAPHDRQRLLEQIKDIFAANPYIDIKPITDTNGTLVTYIMNSNDAIFQTAYLLLIEAFCFQPTYEPTPNHPAPLQSYHFDHIAITMPTFVAFLQSTISSVRAVALCNITHIIMPYIYYLAASTGATQTMANMILYRCRVALGQTHPMFKGYEVRSPDDPEQQVIMAYHTYRQGIGPSLWSGLLSLIQAVQITLIHLTKMLSKNSTEQLSIVDKSRYEVERSYCYHLLGKLAVYLGDPRTSLQSEFRTQGTMPLAPFNIHEWLQYERGSDVTGDLDVQRIEKIAAAYIARHASSHGNSHNDDDDDNTHDNNTIDNDPTITQELIDDPSGGLPRLDMDAISSVQTDPRLIPQAYAHSLTAAQPSARFFWPVPPPPTFYENIQKQQENAKNTSTDGTTTNASTRPPVLPTAQLVAALSDRCFNLLLSQFDVYTYECLSPLISTLVSTSLSCSLITHPFIYNLDKLIAPFEVLHPGSAPPPPPLPSIPTLTTLQQRSIISLLIVVLPSLRQSSVFPDSVVPAFQALWKQVSKDPSAPDRKGRSLLTSAQAQMKLPSRQYQHDAPRVDKFVQQVIATASPDIIVQILCECIKRTSLPPPEYKHQNIVRSHDTIEYTNALIAQASLPTHEVLLPPYYLHDDKDVPITKRFYDFISTFPNSNAEARKKAFSQRINITGTDITQLHNKPVTLPSRKTILSLLRLVISKIMSLRTLNHLRKEYKQGLLYTVLSKMATLPVALGQRRDYDPVIMADLDKDWEQYQQNESSKGGTNDTSSADNKNNNDINTKQTQQPHLKELYKNAKTPLFDALDGLLDPVPPSEKRLTTPLSSSSSSSTKSNSIVEYCHTISPLCDTSLEIAAKMPLLTGQAHLVAPSGLFGLFASAPFEYIDLALQYAHHVYSTEDLNPVALYEPQPTEMILSPSSPSSSESNNQPFTQPPLVQAIQHRMTAYTKQSTQSINIPWVIESLGERGHEFANVLLDGSSHESIPWDTRTIVVQDTNTSSYDHNSSANTAANKCKNLMLWLHKNQTPIKVAQPSEDTQSSSASSMMTPAHNTKTSMNKSSSMIPFGSTPVPQRHHKSSQHRHELPNKSALVPLYQASNSSVLQYLRPLPPTPIQQKDMFTSILHQPYSLKLQSIPLIHRTRISIPFQSPLIRHTLVDDLKKTYKIVDSKLDSTTYSPLEALFALSSTELLEQSRQIVQQHTIQKDDNTGSAPNTAPLTRSLAIITPTSLYNKYSTQILIVLLDHISTHPSQYIDILSTNINNNTNNNKQLSSRYSRNQQDAQYVYSPGELALIYCQRQILVSQYLASLPDITHHIFVVLYFSVFSLDSNISTAGLLCLRDLILHRPPYRIPALLILLSIALSTRASTIPASENVLAMTNTTINVKYIIETTGIPLSQSIFFPQQSLVNAAILAQNLVIALGYGNLLLFNNDTYDITASSSTTTNNKNTSTGQPTPAHTTAIPVHEYTAPNPYISSKIERFFSCHLEVCSDPLFPYNLPLPSIDYSTYTYMLEQRALAASKAKASSTDGDNGDSSDSIHSSGDVLPGEALLPSEPFNTNMSDDVPVYTPLTPAKTTKQSQSELTETLRKKQQMIDEQKRYIKEQHEKQRNLAIYNESMHRINMQTSDYINKIILLSFVIADKNINFFTHIITLFNNVNAILNTYDDNGNIKQSSQPDLPSYCKNNTSSNQSDIKKITSKNNKDDNTSSLPDLDSDLLSDNNDSNNNDDDLSDDYDQYFMSLVQQQINDDISPSSSSSTWIRQYSRQLRVARARLISNKILEYIKKFATRHIRDKAFFTIISENTTIHSIPLIRNIFDSVFLARIVDSDHIFTSPLSVLDLPPDVLIQVRTDVSLIPQLDTILHNIDFDPYSVIFVAPTYFVHYAYQPCNLNAYADSPISYMIHDNYKILLYIIRSLLSIDDDDVRYAAFKRIFAMHRPERNIELLYLAMLSDIYITRPRNPSRRAMRSSYPLDQSDFNPTVHPSHWSAIPIMEGYKMRYYYQTTSPIDPPSEYDILYTEGDSDWKPGDQQPPSHMNPTDPVFKPTEWYTKTPYHIRSSRLRTLLALWIAQESAYFPLTVILTTLERWSTECKRPLQTVPQDLLEKIKRTNEEIQNSNNNSSNNNNKRVLLQKPRTQYYTPRTLMHIILYTTLTHPDSPSSLLESLNGFPVFRFWEDPIYRNDWLCLYYLPLRVGILGHPPALGSTSVMGPAAVRAFYRWVAASPRDFKQLLDITVSQVIPHLELFSILPSSRLSTLISSISSNDLPIFDNEDIYLYLQQFIIDEPGASPELLTKFRAAIQTLTDLIPDDKRQAIDAKIRPPVPEFFAGLGMGGLPYHMIPGFQMGAYGTIPGLYTGFMQPLGSIPPPPPPMLPGFIPPPPPPPMLSGFIPPPPPPDLAINDIQGAGTKRKMSSEPSD